MEKSARISMSKKVWGELYTQLRNRGMGIRESGAFLLGQDDSTEITDVLYYDSLEPNALNSGAIHITAKAFIALADYCLTHHLTVKADIHTHPGKITRQSGIDETNPMIKIKGHIALIVPSYAMPKKCNLKLLGIHEFLGDGYNWRSYQYKDGIVKIMK